MKLDLYDTKIIRCLEEAYGLCIESLTLLPIGADFKTTVYRVAAPLGKSYFLKVRSGPFLEASVTVPKYLWDLGARHVISPLPTKFGDLWLTLGAAKAVLYPYVEGHTGAGTPLSKEHWHDFGAAVKNLHLTGFPENVTQDIPKEQFSSTAGIVVKEFLTRIEGPPFETHVAKKTAAFLHSKSAEIRRIIEQTEILANILQSRPLEKVLCHADLHGWNLLIDQSSTLFIVDWDTLIFAPKERDLMFVGAGIWDTTLSQAEESAYFYAGYGQATINHEALCYYRFERILQDLEEYVTHIISSQREDAKSLAESFHYLTSNFRADGTIERAWASWKIASSRARGRS
ncbi:MAG: phosphotransferase [Alphaproteobacteria bacterium]|jgi:spectinomycin phosphotransferase|nr:phosphotransferase [Alphaproteobacteria bacterium]